MGAARAQQSVLAGSPRESGADGLRLLSITGLTGLQTPADMQGERNGGLAVPLLLGGALRSICEANDLG